MKIQLLILMLISTTLLMNCENDVQVVDSQGSIKGFTINYGTSFGFCVGPCRREMNIVNDEIAFTVYYTEGRGATGGTPKTYTEKLSDTLANALNQNVDFETFKKLEERIGCPDCADGGSEWVEITKGDTKHRVTFEFGKAPKELEKLVKPLREKRLSFEEKYVK